MQAASTIGEIWVSYKVCLFKPRLGNNDNIADFYGMGSGITGTFPLGATPLVPSKQNIGFTTQDPSSYNVISVDPTFQGYILVNANYTISSFGANDTDEFRPPNITPTVGNITDVTAEWLGDPASQQLGRLTRVANAGYTPVTSSVAVVFKIEGGYGSGGELPTFHVQGLVKDSGIAIDSSECTINIIALPSQAATPSF
jgi:hypothetical protein